MGRANPKYYRGEVHKDADIIYHDGGNARLVYVHEQAGIPCEYVDYVGEETPPADEPALEYNAPWYTVYDRRGEKVGKSTRDEDEARERLAALRAGEEG